jgi:hypothetical protein
MVGALKAQKPIANTSILNHHLSQKLKLIAMDEFNTLYLWTAAYISHLVVIYHNFLLLFAHNS